ncbi:stage III sporulation protein AA [Cuneatibacter sp. NSJ-177]|uniref:stage III sporulation protein AA n=1 Tax=Cuneatibacter sp. NSJ-177 TaxID=2931401 RepID=UPI001FCFB2FE|nr:stage III sporulation protein AA [Cuneatibacter sp. NSJ-177]MCJ7834160.1 stage III sporulation protein AA [Cuneatibacter sp. NSJ-177]
MKKEELICIFSRKIRSILERSAADFLFFEEIRLRVGQPLCICRGRGEEYLTPSGRISGNWREAYAVTAADIRETLEFVSHYSLYAFEEELRQGFITIPGGHRVGLAGKAVVQGGDIRGLKYISFLNIRLAHQVPGCADGVLPFLWKRDRFCHTLIVSPPRLGKTTLLRDIIRQVSDGGEHPPQTVGVVDERSELGACSSGVPQNDLGRHTDVLDGCPKAAGILMLLRTMSPRIIAVDEVGSQEDLEALSYSLHCGCGILATVHGSSLEDLKKKPVLCHLVGEGIFERYLILSAEAEGRVAWKVMDESGRRLGEGYR